MSGSGVHSKPNLLATPKWTLGNNSHSESVSVTFSNDKFELLLAVSNYIKCSSLYISG